MTTVTMPKDKSVGAALVLTFFFGPLGLLYTVAWWAAVLMLVGAVITGLLTFGIGAGAFWAASMIWGAVAASNKHSRYFAWLATQPQTLVAPQGVPAYLPPGLPGDLPPSSSDAAPELAESPVSESRATTVAQLSAAASETVGQRQVAPESASSNREEASLRKLKRLRELGLISETEASVKRGEILSRLFPSSAEDQAITTTGMPTASGDADLAADNAPTAEMDTLSLARQTPVSPPPTPAEGPAAAAPMAKRYLIFGVIVVALLVIAIIAALALGHGGKSSKSTGTSSTTPQAAVLAHPSPAASAISDGTYLVGTDIPAGKYKGSVTGSTGYWQISSDANDSNIIANNNVTGPFYVQARAGQYLELTGVKITKVNSSTPTSALTSGAISNGTYLVGTDIPAGKYKGTTTGDSGYWQISSDANGSNIIANNNVTGPFYVQVKKGQYLELMGVRITEVAASASASGAAPSASGTVVRKMITSTLTTYFAALNARHFSTAWLQLTPHLGQTITVAHLTSADRTTRDSAVVVHRVTALDARTAAAFVTFTSTQAASFGPNGDTRDNWTLDYAMKLVGDRWLIDGVAAHNGSTHTSG
jgi:hypothetical protein